jgi:hypothetical protein
MLFSLETNRGLEIRFQAKRRTQLIRLKYRGLFELAYCHQMDLRVQQKPSALFSLQTIG